MYEPPPEPVLYQYLTRPALRWLLAGWLFCVINIPLGGFDVVPDIIGYALLLYGLRRLPPLLKPLLTVARALFVGGVLYLLLLMLSLLLAAPGPLLLGLAHLALKIANMVAVYGLCQVCHAFFVEVGNKFWIIRSKQLAQLYMAFVILAYLTSFSILLAWAGLASTLCAVVAGAAVAVMLYRCYEVLP